MIRDSNLSLNSERVGFILGMALEATGTCRTFDLEHNGTATVSVLGNSLRREREIFTISKGGEDLDKEGLRKNAVMRL